jgi:hypothetical protein
MKWKVEEGCFTIARRLSRMREFRMALMLPGQDAVTSPLRSVTNSVLAKVPDARLVRVMARVDIAEQRIHDGIVRRAGDKRGTHVEHRHNSLEIEIAIKRLREMHLASKRLIFENTTGTFSVGFARNCKLVLHIGQPDDDARISVYFDNWSLGDDLGVDVVQVSEVPAEHRRSIMWGRNVQGPTNLLISDISVDGNSN